MKAGIHPQYHEITVKRTDGSTFITKSTYGKPGSVITLQADPLNHPAWQKGSFQRLDVDGLADKFKAKYGIK